MKALFLILAGALLLSPGFSATAAPPKIAMEEFMIPAVDPGIKLYVRNEYPKALKAVSAEKILLFVHGATYPAETAFDLPLNGLSWMAYIAQHGYEVYLVDVRNSGKSTRPARNTTTRW